MPSLDTLTEDTLAQLWALRDSDGIPITAELAVRDNRGRLIGGRIFGSMENVVIDPYLEEDWKVRPRGTERGTSR